MGARNSPFYRVVVSDRRFATSGRFIESIGWYDPLKADAPFSLNLERAEYWLGVGATASPTVKSLVKKAREGLSAVTPGATRRDLRAVDSAKPKAKPVPAEAEASPEAQAPAASEDASAPAAEG